MLLPENFEQRSFAEWNYLVRGIVQVWELARALGVEAALEEHLGRDADPAFVERLGRLGNEWATLSGLLSCALWPALAAALPDSIPARRVRHLLGWVK